MQSYFEGALQMVHDLCDKRAPHRDHSRQSISSRVRIQVRDTYLCTYPRDWFEFKCGSSTIAIAHMHGQLAGSGASCSSSKPSTSTAARARAQKRCRITLGLRGLYRARGIRSRSVPWRCTCENCGMEGVCGEGLSLPMTGRARRLSDRHMHATHAYVQCTRYNYVVHQLALRQHHFEFRSRPWQIGQMHGTKSRRLRRKYIGNEPTPLELHRPIQVRQFKCSEPTTKQRSQATGSVRASNLRDTRLVQSSRHHRQHRRASQHLSEELHGFRGIHAFQYAYG